MKPLTFVALSVALFAACGPGANSTGLGATPEIVDFRDVPANETRHARVTVFNASGQARTLRSVLIEGPEAGSFEVTTATPPSLMPGESKDLTVAFRSSPSSTVSVRARLMVATTEDGAPLEVWLKGTTK